MSFIDKRAIVLTACLAGAAALCACGSDSKTSDGGGSSADADSKSDTPGGNTSGGDACKGIDLQTSRGNCGACGNACGENAVCQDGACVCGEDFDDCDNDGICENWGECICRPGDTLPCYFGAEDTLFEGSRCKAGVFECAKTPFGTYQWGSECVGMVLPSYDYVCDPNQPDLDLDCDGRADATQDDDGDGYAICNEAGDAISDCCDNAHMCNADRPELIHPGAIDCKGNNIDDNCDGIIDDSEFACGQKAVATDCQRKERNCGDLSNWKWKSDRSFDAQGLKEIASALDMCMSMISADDDAEDGGIIEISATQSGSSKRPNVQQINVLEAMKDIEGNALISPREGGSFVLLSTGLAIDVYRMNGATWDHQFSDGHAIPEPYRTAHGGKLQSHESCNSSDSISDSIRLHIKLRAPKDAKGFSFDFRFFSREYPFYICSEYNDFFLTLLTDESGKPLPGVNDDGNISFDKKGNPVSVNNAFFTTCANPQCRSVFSQSTPEGCPFNMHCDKTSNTCGTGCADGTAELAAYFHRYYSSSTDRTDIGQGGGTAWLTTQAPVEPGEIFNLDFYIWDTHDFGYDSTVILDNFRWKCGETTVGTDFAEGGIVVN